MNSITKMILTIPETVKRLAEDGMPVSKYTLKQWVDKGLIPCTYAGRKRLLYYPNVVAFIQGTNVAPPSVKSRQETRAPGIRRIKID